jgi:hypothetical protein
VLEKIILLPSGIPADPPPGFGGIHPGDRFVGGPESGGVGQNYTPQTPARNLQMRGIPKFFPSTS